MEIKMGIIKILLICLVMTKFAYARSYPGVTDIAESRQTSTDFIQTISTVIVEWISRGIEYLSELFDLKIRTIKFISSLYTTDNLTLLKRFLNIALRFGHWIYENIPDSTSAATQSFISYLFPDLNREEHIDDEEIPSVSTSVSDSSFTRSMQENEVDDIDEEDNAEKYAKQVMDLNSLINARYVSK